ncbi:PQQ-binding-like beta-propeller repeat protein [Arthrobacter roseus]|uniref:outer membrane protein assembly factor BamB family protein n=1 Tax=Arthrobacter roseus TaxID=136274 RepID=UPI0019628C87|nr:PQQ-binding-like beta-propeller repeat protein [Arthrobacter roseus]MBM7847915.1 outer membrane protein assembly factor BamB [Arthrobacter roseus]
MIKRTASVILALLMVFAPATIISAPLPSPSSSSQEWTQYRLSADKNAVVVNTALKDLGEVTYATNDQVRATPVVVGNRLFVGNHDSGDLFAFDLTTGEEIWHNQAPNWVHSEMIYRDGTVFVGYGNRFPQENKKFRGTGESGVLALEAETGRIIWDFKTDGEVMPTPAFANGSVYVVTGDHNLYQIDPETGKEQSRTDIGSAVSMSSPALKDGILYFGAGHPPPGFSITAYDTGSNKILWQSDFPETLYGMDDVPPAVHDSVLVTTAIEAVPEDQNREEGEFTHTIYGVNTSDGSVLWKDTLGKGKPKPNNKSGAPMIYNSNVFVGSPTTKTFYSYDLMTGERLWQFDSGTVKGAPVAKDGVVYFGNTDGEIHGLSAESGEEQGSHQLEGKLAPAGPIIVNNSVIVGSQDSNVYAFPLADANGENAKALLVWGTIAVAVVLLIGLVALFLLRRQRKQSPSHPHEKVHPDPPPS